MKLLCVILNYKTAGMTLDAVQAARIALERVPDHRIDVVDNDSKDGSYEKLAKDCAAFPDVQVLQTGHNGGFGYGNNFAIRRALASSDPPELVYILNSDAFPEPDAVEVLVDFMASHPACGIAGSAIHGTDGNPHVTAFRFPTLASEVGQSFRLGMLNRVLPESEVPILPRPTETRPVDWLAGASMIIRREVLEEVGLFDETFFLYFEETDLCRRARLRGHDVYYVVESRVAHVGHGSTGLKDKQKPMPRYWFDSRRYYFLKNHGRAYTWAANAVHAAGLATYKVRARLQRKDDPDPARFLRDFVRYNFLVNRP
jgi:N-acetylglucosaminyl-diphospho-decaprenol L-rhamnosyltransferase